ncbi:MAG TPA: adenylyl-sulfate kinase [Nocardioidaceae bacterium]|nr:adenylyl-sulfate kinase [Nocardioidaceae bacterium]
MPVSQLCPAQRALDDLELMALGVIPPVFEPTGGNVVLEAPGVEGPLELVDPEGLPLATIEPEGTDGTLVWGPVQLLSHPAYGAFRRLYLAPADVRQRYAGATTVPVAGPLTEQDLATLRAAGPVVLLALAGKGTPQGLSSIGLIRATLAAAELLDDAAVVAVPLASRGDAEADHVFGQQVVQAYATGAIIGVTGEGELPDAVADIVELDRPDRDEQGLVLFFTGLSGSGKSTLARALHDLVLEQGTRTITSLDGDVVRRNLSAGLTFSKEDRETNIRRIGWVAAEISRHGGVAICSPIAPFDETRRQVRAMVDEAGGAFFLIHVATPLEECERRDRKGLYAKARRGEIPEFTGISSPYEEPADADVRVDTTGRTIEDALGDVLSALDAAGYLHLKGSAS